MSKTLAKLSRLRPNAAQISGYEDPALKGQKREYNSGWIKQIETVNSGNLLTVSVLTRFSRRSAECLLGFTLLLQACVPGDIMSFQGKPKLTTTVTVSDVQIILGGPRGYCVSEKQRRDSAAGSFVVFGVCGGGNKENTRKARGLLIANVSANPELGKSKDVGAIQAQLRSASGRKSLSNSGDAATVDILDTRVRNNVVYIHTRDSKGPLIPDTTNEQWRGFLVVKGRLVSVSMLNFIDSAVSTGEVFVQIREFSNQIKQLNIASE